KKRFLRESFSTNIYEYVIKQYDEALKALDQGHVATARNIFIKPYHGPHQGNLRHFGQYQFDRKFEHLSLGVGVLVASGFLGGLAARGLMGGEEILLGSGARCCPTPLSRD